MPREAPVTSAVFPLSSMLSSLPICFDVIDLVIQVVQALPKRNLGETMSELVLSERDGALHILTLNRPARHNAMDEAMSALFRTRLTNALEERESSAILIRAAGKSFGSGRDTQGLGHRARDDSDFHFVRR